MMKRDCYEVLGISREANPEEIKRAYRRMAMKYHPDRNPGDKSAEEKFKEAAESYSILIDPDKRSIYDRYGYDGLKGEGFTGFTGFNSSIFEGFEDILGNFFNFGFGDIFGMRSQRQGGRYPQRGRDLVLELDISLEEAASGLEREFKLNRSELCSVCHGSRLRPGTQKETCNQCRGSGQVRYQQGFFSISRTCPNCRGQGEIITNPCENCSGKGRIREKTIITVKIPPGVDSGTKLRIEGEGDAGDKGAQRGDLYVVTHVKPHPYFEREESNLFCQVTISFVKAAMGTTVEIPVFNEKETLKIPHGTQPGKIFIIKGKGIKSLRTNHRGDLYIKVNVETPENLNKEQKELLKRFAQSRKENLDFQESKLDRIKKVFH